MFSRKFAPKNNAPLFNDTVYSAKKIDENYYKIDVLKLIDTKSRNEINYKRMEDLLGINPDSKLKDKLLLYHHSEKELLKLKNIYQTYKNEKNNPFIDYMNDLYQKFPEKFSEQYIKSLIARGQVLYFDPVTEKSSIFGNLKFISGKVSDPNLVV
ncbi:UNVERIFIED_CONTAM: hypothetical protein O8I53_07385 [Campylobacter lari]